MSAVKKNFVILRHCPTPVLILPDDIPVHPYAVAMECALLAPKAEVSMYPWKDPNDRISPCGPASTFLSPDTSIDPAGRDGA
jgi:hypothetical protein